MLSLFYSFKQVTHTYIHSSCLKLYSLRSWGNVHKLGMSPVAACRSWGCCAVQSPPVVTSSSHWGVSSHMPAAPTTGVCFRICMSHFTVNIETHVVCYLLGLSWLVAQHDTLINTWHCCHSLLHLQQINPMSSDLHLRVCAPLIHEWTLHKTCKIACAVQTWVFCNGNRCLTA